jgi:hypothetical protein
MAAGRQAPVSCDGGREREGREGKNLYRATRIGEGLAAYKYPSRYLCKLVWVPWTRNSTSEGRRRLRILDALHCDAAAAMLVRAREVCKVCLCAALHHVKLGTDSCRLLSCCVVRLPSLMPVADRHTLSRDRKEDKTGEMWAGHVRAEGTKAPEERRSVH